MKSQKNFDGEIVDADSLRMSRTIYFKHKHFKYIADFAEEQGCNISEATDIILQCGIAWQEQLKAQIKGEQK